MKTYVIPNEQTFLNNNHKMLISFVIGCDFF